MTFVIDTGPLTHFAQAGLLPLLEKILHGQSCWRPPQVSIELNRGPERLVNQMVLTSPWIREQPLGEYADALLIPIWAELGGTGDQHLGEAECLALAATVPAVTYLDDGAECLVAGIFDIEYCTTLDLLQDSLDASLITPEEAEEAVDLLLSTGYKLPLTSGAAFLRALGIPERDKQ